MTPEESKIADALFARVVFLATPESRDAALETAVTTYLHFLQACEVRGRLPRESSPREPLPFEKAAEINAYYQALLRTDPWAAREFVRTASAEELMAALCVG